MHEPTPTGGDPPAASADLLPIVYEELRRIARHRIAHEGAQTLQATALVHEAYLRLTASGETPRWDSRRHFFGAASEAMRRILIDRARMKKRLKRGGGGQERVSLEDAAIEAATPGGDLEAIDAALERFAAADPGGAELVKLRFYAGLTMAEIADLLGVSERTVKRQWAYAKAWLQAEMQRSEAAES